MKLPVNYNAIHWTERNIIREEYIRIQDGECCFCGMELKSFILSEDYQEISEENSSYYYLAIIKEFLEETNFEIGVTYLEASWQVELIADLYAKYLKLSLTNFEIAASKLVNIENEYDNYLFSMYMQVELNRKLGNFDDAKN